MIKDPALIMIIFVLIVFSGIWLQNKVQFIRKLSAAMYCIFVAMILANLGIIATESSAHEAISSYVVPFSISMILFSAKLKDLKLAAPPAIKVFIIHSLGAVIAFGIGASIFKPFIGENVWQAAGIFISGAMGEP
ncbi:DUF819 family protein [Salinicoccus roseus]|uniref:DUF819 family protein n=1 Tax=Salinicoccus roseus TaxID=45670 RepID=UPI0035236879